MRETVKSVFDGAWADGRRVWPQLLVTDIAYKLVAFVLLTPMVSVAMSLGVKLSGSAVLADQDILFFFLRPVGMSVLIILLALFLAILALEQACLMSIGVAAAENVEIGFMEALRFSLSRARQVISLTARLTARCLLFAAPFLAGIGLVYMFLLTDYDINYYLTEKPPEFLLGLGLAGLMVAGLLWVLVPRLIGWGLALPLVMFEGVAPGEALAESRRRVVGHRPTFARVLVLWGIGAFSISLATPALVAAAGRLLAPFGRGNVNVVLVLMLLLAVLWGLVNLLVTWLAASAFALLVVRLYEQFGGGRGEIVARLGGAAELGGAQAVRFSLKGMLAVLVVMALVAGGIGWFMIEQVKGNDEVAIIAHRGASAVAPENTMAAVHEALAQGADFVEIDVQETADGEVVVIHDSDFMKIGGVNLKIWDATWEQLGDIDIGSWFGPEFADERVPHLRDVLEACRDKAIVNIELKYYGHDERLEERVAEVVEAAGASDGVVTMSLKYDAVAKMKALRPDWTAGLLTATALGDLTKVEADFLAVSTSLATRRFVRQAHRQGKDVYVWTVNDPIQMFHMMNLGVDGLITDEPGLARKVLERRAEMNSVERLVVGIAILFGAAAPDPPTSDDIGESTG